VDDPESEDGESDNDESDNSDNDNDDANEHDQGGGDDNDGDHELNAGEDNEDVANEEEANGDEEQNPEINIPDVTLSTPAPEARENAGVGITRENTGVPGRIAREITGVQGPRNTPTRTGNRFFHDTTREHEHMNEQIMDERHGPRGHHFNLRERKPRNYDHLYGPDHIFATFEEPMGELFMTEQMSLKKGLKHFGKSGADAVISELRQLDYRDVIKPVPARSLTRDQKRAALNYLMYLKQKRCGRIKARGCADGRKQRLYKTKDETSSPTVSTEAVFLTAVINAQE
jgi:hypothetical protein